VPDVLTGFWQGIGGKLADRWMAVGTPALIFWFGGLLAFAYNRHGVSALTDRLARWSAPVQVAILVAALLGVAASGVIVARLTPPCLRILEGYWWPVLDPVRELLARRARRKADDDEAAAQRLAPYVYGERPATATQLLKFARLDHRRRMRPEEADRDRFMPTRIGNILRAAELRPKRKYGLDAIVVWPRLWLILPDSTRQELLAARSALDSAVAAAIWGVLFCAFSAWTLWCIPVGLGVAVAAVVGWVPARSEAFGDMLEAAYDTSRNALYQQLRWPLPKDPYRERSHGERLTRYLLRGPEEHDPTFKPPA
jgi:hypothetical protein